MILKPCPSYATPCAYCVGQLTCPTCSAFPGELATNADALAAGHILPGLSPYGSVQAIAPA
ncbi:hypothetical protein BD414DRAFT_501109 [Trametes punicea]|nr:hypothetical protein BD414DRAFT_501109 [Trametes punicea]